MNTSIFYMTSTVFALGGLWLLWELGVRPLMLDNFRDSLFALRDELYKLSQEGRIECNAHAYRDVEGFLNGMIRYAHRFTFSSFVIGRFEMDSARARGEFVDYSNQLFTAIETQEEAASELKSIVIRAGNLLPSYAAKSSLLFMVIALTYLVILRFQPVLALTQKREAVTTFEREVHLAAQADAYAVA